MSSTIHDRLERLQAMAADVDAQTWDLSPTDREAIAWITAHCDELRGRIFASTALGDTLARVRLENARLCTEVKLAYRELLEPWPESLTLGYLDRQAALAKLELIELRTVTREIIDACDRYWCCCEPGDDCHHLSAKGRAVLEEME